MENHRLRILALILFSALALTRAGVASTEILSTDAQEVAIFKCLQATYDLPAQVIEHLNDTGVFVVNAIQPSDEQGKFQVETSLNGYDGIVQLTSSNLVFINKYKNTKSLKGDEESVGTFRMIAEDRAERIVKFVGENGNPPELDAQIKARFLHCPISSIGGGHEDTPFLRRLSTRTPKEISRN